MAQFAYLAILGCQGPTWYSSPVLLTVLASFIACQSDFHLRYTIIGACSGIWAESKAVGIADRTSDCCKRRGNEDNSRGGGPCYCASFNSIELARG
jgi:hypothetical protein